MALKIGMIGTNFISDDFCEAAAQVPGAEICAIYSRKQETGDAFAAKHGIPRVYTDFDEFLDSDLDAVYVASPNFAHCPQTLQALKRKKHVLCEKVMAVNEQEVRSMIDCARENTVVLLEAMRPDFDPAFALKCSSHGYRCVLYPFSCPPFRNAQKHPGTLHETAKRV